jgi:mRNA-degrading endonuclease RelE of RelBE toxin-antitoxin system
VDENLNIKDIQNFIKEEIKNFSFSQFKKDIKKINDKELLLRIWGAIREINRDFKIGELKKGNLKGIRTYKFKVKSRNYRIAYYVEKEKINIIYLHVGNRENFYKDIEKHFSKNILKMIEKNGI